MFDIYYRYPTIFKTKQVLHKLSEITFNVELFKYYYSTNNIP